MRETTAHLEQTRPQHGGASDLPFGVTGSPLLVRPLVNDVPIAVLVTIVALIGVAASLPTRPLQLPDPPAAGAASLVALGLGLLLLQTVPLAWRRATPLAVLAITAASLATASFLGYPLTFAALGPLIALYSVAAYKDLGTSIPAGLASGSAILLMIRLTEQPAAIGEFVALCLAVGASWALGAAVHFHRSRISALEDQVAGLVEGREQAIQAAVRDERRNMARELHDTVAHDVGVVVARASVANERALDQPDEALEGLADIETSAREALVGMRQLAGDLRGEATASNLHRPRPGLENLDDLVAGMRDAGMVVDLAIDGDASSLDPDVDRAAYRIVQESLTNALKHAPGAATLAEVRVEGESVHLTIEDDGANRTRHKGRSTSVGFGLVGMRERAERLGGQVEGRALPAGGFRVTATLPVNGGTP